MKFFHLSKTQNPLSCQLCTVLTPPALPYSYSAWVPLVFILPMTLKLCSCGQAELTGSGVQAVRGYSEGLQTKCLPDSCPLAQHRQVVGLSSIWGNNTVSQWSTSRDVNCSILEDWAQSGLRVAGSPAQRGLRAASVPASLWTTCRAAL